MSFPFATAPRSFFQDKGRRITPDGAFWAHMGIVAGVAGLPSVPPHRWGIDWQRCFRSLGVALGQHELRRLELHVAQQGWARSPIARRDSPTVRQEAERPTGAAAQPAVDPGSTPGGSDQCDPRCFYRDRGVDHDAPEDCRYAEPNGGVTGCWPCNGTGCDRCMPEVEPG